MDLQTLKAHVYGVPMEKREGHLLSGVSAANMANLFAMVDDLRKQLEIVASLLPDQTGELARESYALIHLTGIGDE